MSYNPTQKAIVHSGLEAVFADAWREAVLGDQQTQKNFVRRISRKGVNGSAGNV
ncbi:MAG: hypothetical protein ACOC8X_04720 [Chloroflexota bacterium]